MHKTHLFARLGFLVLIWFIIVSLILSEIYFILLTIHIHQYSSDALNQLAHFFTVAKPILYLIDQNQFINFVIANPANVSLTLAILTPIFILFVTALMVVRYWWLLHLWQLVQIAALLVFISIYAGIVLIFLSLIKLFWQDNTWQTWIIAYRHLPITPRKVKKHLSKTKKPTLSKVNLPEKNMKQSENDNLF